MMHMICSTDGGNNVAKSIKELRKHELSELKKYKFHPELDQIIKNASHNYIGQITTLESAIGALIIGQLYGWRVLRIIHGSNTYIRYEKVFGEDFKFKDYCEDRSVLARRSVGLGLADSIKSFWKVATGKFKTDIDTKIAQK